MRFPAAVLLPLLAAACAQPALERPAAPAPPPAAAPGLERVMGRPADAVVALLGEPTFDRSEGPGRHLQYARQGCVLDLFLYPPAAARAASGAPAAGARPGPSVVTYAEARTSAGGRIEAAACLANQLRARPVG